MNNTSPVGLRQCIRYLNSIADSLVQRKAALREDVGYGFSLYILHSEEEKIVYFFDIVNGHDMRMVERRGCPSLLNKPTATVLVGHDGWHEQLQCDRAIEVYIN